MILSLFVVSLLFSCSTKKNTKTTRFYHAFTTRYNIYYNGKTAYDEAYKNQINNHKESYSEQIHLYPISAQPKDKANPGGPFDRAIEKSNKAIKLHSLSVKPERKAGWRSNPKMVAMMAQEEYNPFLKNSWLMLGQAQFHNADFLQASATFSYISRHYATDPLVATEARLWQARCYAEMDWFFEAEDILTKLKNSGYPEKNEKLYAKTAAIYLVKEGRFEEAVPHMKLAIKAEKNKRQRSRMKYLLGQIYTDLGQTESAYKMFGEVARSNPPYELEFAARIRQTEVFSAGDFNKVVRLLNRMAKSDKNTELLDQVYYALGNVYLNRQDTTNAIINYKLGIEKSTKGGLEKALNEIQLGDIYFTQRDYVNAQPCFSGALGGIHKEYKDYERVSKLSAVLDELVVHVEAVHLQDSLQTLAAMPEEERLAVIDKIIEELIKAEKEAEEEAQREAYLAEQATQGGIDRPGTELGMVQAPTMPGGSAFYFYNSQIVAQGKTQFQRQWGRRTLEDDWRRRDKKVSTFDENAYNDQAMAEEGAPLLDEEGNPIPMDSTAVAGDPAADFSDDPKSREYYIQQLPLTEEDIAASNLIIIDGLFNMSMIYKDKLEDFDLATESFETLERRFPENDYLLESYYQMYLIALKSENNLLAEEYKAKLIAAFPESDYAIAIADPNYAYNIRMMDAVQDSIYQQTYDSYLAGNVEAVRTNYQEVSAKYPLASLLPKFMFLDALTHVETGDVDAFKEALKALVEKYPNADVSELAGEMLKGVLRGRQLMQGSVRGMTWNLRFGAGEDGALSAADSARTFSPETEVPHQMLLIYQTGLLNNNQLLYAVAAYNFANLLVKNLDMTFEIAGPITMLQLKPFANFEEIHQYYDMIYEPEGYATLLSKDVTMLPISDENYETLMRGKTIDEYIDFFEEHFADQAPEMLARWTAHRQSDMEEVEAEEKATPPPAPKQATPPPVKQEEETPAPPTEEPITAPEEEVEEPMEQPITAPEETTEEEPLPAEEENAEEATTVVEQDGALLIPDKVSTDTIPETAEPETTLPEEATEKEQESPAVRRRKAGQDLTLQDIEEIRKREAEEQAVRDEEERIAREEAAAAAAALKEQQALDREEQRKQREIEQKEKAKSRAELQKQKEKERKEKQKQAAIEQKKREKERRLQQKQREKEIKEKQREKERERKAKEAERKKLQAEKEKARREAEREKKASARKR